MRLTFVTLTFLFFINVHATPIHPSRSNAAALRRRAPNEHDTPGNDAVAKCKRATDDELMGALSTADEAVPLQQAEDCSVYRLPVKVDNENVILKVIKNNDEKKSAEREAWGNHNVGQLLGWAHTPDEALYYLFIINMGVPYWETELKKNRKLVKQLQHAAEERYQSQYHLKHDDISRYNWVFRQVNNEWQAELIDWEDFTKESGYKGYTDPPTPFEIDPKCVFVPPLMKKWVDHGS